MTDRLLHLASRCGIAADYEDIWGKSHSASPAALGRLLAAMGVVDTATPSPDSIELAIAANESRGRGAYLPKVIVLREGSSVWTLPLQWPQGGLDQLQWHIETEDGSAYSGSASAPGQPELAAGQQPKVGYHRLVVRHNGDDIASCRLIVTPRTAWQPPALRGNGQLWGTSAQLYAVRSQRNWGIGDYTDLKRLIGLWGRAGAGVVGVNPLHAMFGHNPSHASPYSPSSRLFFNTQYLDVEAIADFAECEIARAYVHSDAFQARLVALRTPELVDYPGVAAAKGEVLALLYAHFRREHLAHDTQRAFAFRAFVAERGFRLRLHALFEALQAHFHAADASVWGWPVWPEDFRDPESARVAQFEREQLEAVEYYEYLQWQADMQLADAARSAKDLGMGVGLYADLAVSVDRAGSEAWSGQSLFALGASVGAPPDEYNADGQNWGLPPFDPVRLQDAAYEPFIIMLRANMRHAGALRIDHVMALMRLFWIAEGDNAADGAYVHYAFEDLLGIVALESQRHRCLVIGEDLGTVPDGVRHQLADAGVLSYRVLFFEREDGGGFKSPADYPSQSVAVASTHDLHTLAGWWCGADLKLRHRLGLLGDDTTLQTQMQILSRDRSLLLQALASEGLQPGAGASADASTELDAQTARAVHCYLARSPAQVVLVQPDDVLLAIDQVNLPGTTDQVPNWRRKLTLPLEDWSSDPRFIGMTQALSAERPSHPTNGVQVDKQVKDTAPPSRASRAGIPRATYRVQLDGSFGFDAAAALVPYLADLGISHLYCSPPLRARAGSRHGYDVTDHELINPELGGRDGFDRMVTALHNHGLGLIVDIVPNHMGVMGGDNAWWLDVLENGEASAYADYFDIAWHPVDAAFDGRVVLPILGDQYGVVLESGELKLGFEAAEGRFMLQYHEHRLPIDPSCYAGLLRRALRGAPLAAAEGGSAEVERLAAAFARLPPHGTADPAARRHRQSEKIDLKIRLALCVGQRPRVAQAIDRMTEAMNGQVGIRSSFDALDEVISSQPYRLAHWRIAGDEINYRRFFDINELAALRMDRSEVFEATHRLVLELAASGAIDGLRIDHPDGLADPAGYFRRLQLRYAQMSHQTTEPTDDSGAPALGLYVAIEKITAPHENMPRDWAVHGTTGYRFANVLNGVMIDTAAKARLDRVWRAFAGDEANDFDDLSWAGRHQVMASSLAGELTVLATVLLRLAREDRRTRDFTLNSLRLALADVVASFPVYRTYVMDKPSAQDRRFITWALGRAQRRSMGADASVFEFLRRVMLGRPLPGTPPDQVQRYREFMQRFQQYTAPVAAKGIEDTALYAHHRLISVNDVGGDADVFGMSLNGFHGASRDRALSWPHTMLAGSTHDAKRSEDMRARINVISELPAAWRLTVRRWSRMNRRHRRIVDGAQAPTRNDEYQLYQQLIGSLPEGDLDATALKVYAARVEQATLKAARESKVVTSWINPHAAYETALSGFVGALLEPQGNNPFLADLKIQTTVFSWYGALNGITMALVKSLSPGVPDFYQGCELIELSMVDPDNRRPIDFESRRAQLARLGGIVEQSDRGDALRHLLNSATNGAAKMWVIWRALQWRQRNFAMLQAADYLPLEVTGTHANHVIAFARRDGLKWLIVIAARLYASLGLQVGQAPVGDIWGDTRIVWPANDVAPMMQAGGCMTDAVSGRRHPLNAEGVRLAQVLCDFPVAALGSDNTHAA